MTSRMPAPMTDERLDRLVRHVLADRAEDVAADAVSADAMADRIESRLRPTANSRTWVLLAAALLTALLVGGTLAVGGQLQLPWLPPGPQGIDWTAPRSNPDGDLEGGSYVSHPLPAPDDSLTVTFTVPPGWAAAADSGLTPAAAPGAGAPGGMAVLFIDVTTLNGDPCRWSGTADDVSVGPGVDALVEALRSQTAYEVSAPVDVTLGGHRGKRVDIVMPTDLFAGQTASAPGCDDSRFKPWSTSAHGPNPVYAQGPANRWQTNILDVDGTRLVIVVGDFPGTSPADRAELDAIVSSLVIER